MSNRSIHQSVLLWPEVLYFDKHFTTLKHGGSFAARRPLRRRRLPRSVARDIRLSLVNTLFLGFDTMHDGQLAHALLSRAEVILSAVTSRSVRSKPSLVESLACSLSL